MRTPGWVLLTISVGFGACGGSTGRSAEENPEQLIQAACEKIVSLGCSDSFDLEECVSSTREQRESAASDGCGAQFDAMVACIRDRPIACEQSTKEVCLSEVEALDTCESGGVEEDCSMGMGGAPPGAPANYQKCFVGCATYEVDCETNASGQLVCTCISGPKAGATFTPESCKLVTSTRGEDCAA